MRFKTYLRALISESYHKLYVENVLPTPTFNDAFFWLSNYVTPSEIAWLSLIECKCFSRVLYEEVIDYSAF